MSRTSSAGGFDFERATFGGVSGEWLVEIDGISIPREEDPTIRKPTALVSDRHHRRDRRRYLLADIVKQSLEGWIVRRFVGCGARDADLGDSSKIRSYGIHRWDPVANGIVDTQQKGLIAQTVLVKHGLTRAYAV